MKFYICAIAKKENRYILEWIDYHLNLGVDKIILFDNNDPEGERLSDAIPQDYISCGNVVIIDATIGQEKAQMPSYNAAYLHFSGCFDWMAFIDIDEFITVADGVDFKTWLLCLTKMRPGASCIKLNWMCYGDNGNVRYENAPVLERFPEHLPVDKKTIYDFPQNYHVKSIVKSGLVSEGQHLFDNNPHVPSNGIATYASCDDLGNVCSSSNSPFSVPDYTLVWIRHYVTKSAEEFREKIKRGYPDQTKEQSSKTLTPEMFFMWNEWTEEKENVLHEEK